MIFSKEMEEFLESFAKKLGIERKDLCLEFKHIDKCGTEIEGCWHKERGDLVEDAGIKPNLFKNPVSVGELVTKPIKSSEEVLEILKNNWPDETHLMTGLHFHFSFKDIACYCALMSKKFQKHFISMMTAFGKSYPIQNNYFWDRLEDRNRFCRNHFAPEDQIFLKKKIPNHEGRYTQLHYAYGLHKTIESRILPTFVTVECGMAGFLAHIHCFESYLNANPPEPFDSETQYVVQDEEPAEEIADFSKVFTEETGAKLIKKSKPFNLFMHTGHLRAGQLPKSAIKPGVLKAMTYEEIAMAQPMYDGPDDAPEEKKKVDEKPW